MSYWNNILASSVQYCVYWSRYTVLFLKPCDKTIFCWLKTFHTNKNITETTYLLWQLSIQAKLQVQYNVLNHCCMYRFFYKNETISVQTPPSPRTALLVVCITFLISSCWLGSMENMIGAVPCQSFAELMPLIMTNTIQLSKVIWRKVAVMEIVNW